MWKVLFLPSLLRRTACLQPLSHGRGTLNSIYILAKNALAIDLRCQEPEIKS